MSSPKDLLLSAQEHRHRSDQIWKAVIVVLAAFRLEDVVAGQRELPWVLVDVALVALASYFVISGLRRRIATLLHRAEHEETCPMCHHVWLEHGLDGPNCGECEYEIEHEDPDPPASPCRAQRPASLDLS